MKHKIKRIKESHWIINNSKEQRKEFAMLEDELCRDYDSLNGEKDSGLRIIETTSVANMPKDLSIKQKRSTKSRIPTALLNTNKNLVKTNEILIDIVKMIRMSLRVNNVEETGRMTKKNLEDELQHQKQKNLDFAQNMTKVLKTNAEKERHLRSEINSLKMENEKLKRNMENNHQKIVQKADLSNQNYHKQTARKSIIYKRF